MCVLAFLSCTPRSAGARLTALAAQHEAAFDARFAATFPITATPADMEPATLAEVSKAALSNTLGSMGYFVGASRVKLPPGVKRPAPRPGQPQPPGADPSIVEYWREALFSATPSRSFFPRGFLWDEGFHQLLVSRWDGQLSRDAISHWLDLMNKQGWIPREQILGKEARARVPAEFLVQHPSHANPPSLYLPLLAHAAAASSGAGAGSAGSVTEEAERAQAFLKRAWPRLEAWYHWFNSTQAGSQPGSYMWVCHVPLQHGPEGIRDMPQPPYVCNAPRSCPAATPDALTASCAPRLIDTPTQHAENPPCTACICCCAVLGCGVCAHRWKGRDGSTNRELNPKTLMSGLDDYPRASHPTPDERHVDLLAWMALASQAMAAIGTAAGVCGAVVDGGSGRPGGCELRAPASQTWCILKVLRALQCSAACVFAVS